MPRIVCASFETKSPADMPTSAEGSCSLGSTANAVMAPTIRSLVMFLPVSNSTFGPNSCLAPAIGLSFFAFGFRPAELNLGRTCTKLPSRPKPMHVSAIGPTVIPAVLPLCQKICPSVPAVTCRGLDIIPIVERIDWPSVSITCGPQIDSAMRPPMSTSAPLRSCDRAICPFLRASSRRLGVAFSVLSPPPAISRHLQGLEGGAHALRELDADPVGNERQRRADQQEPDEDLR